MYKKPTTMRTLLLYMCGRLCASFVNAVASSISPDKAYTIQYNTIPTIQSSPSRIATTIQPLASLYICRHEILSIAMPYIKHQFHKVS